MIRSSTRSYDVASAKAAIPQFNRWRSRECSALRTDRFHNPTHRIPVKEGGGRLISTCSLSPAQGGTVSANSRMSDQLQLPAARRVKWSLFGILPFAQLSPGTVCGEGKRRKVGMSRTKEKQKQMGDFFLFFTSSSFPSYNEARGRIYTPRPLKLRRGPGGELCSSGT